MTPLARTLIDRYQKGLPVSLTPWADLASELGVTEEEVLTTLDTLEAEGIITRVGPVFNHHRAGASTLIALAVAPSRLEQVASWLNAQEGINHNYEREHFFNLWCVATAADTDSLQARVDGIRKRWPDVPVLDLPMVEQYHIDLAFPIRWEGVEAHHADA